MSFNLVPTKTTKVTRKEMAKAIKKAEESMNPKLREELKDVRSWIARKVRDGLRSLWQLGKRMKGIHEAEHVYGANAVGKLACCIQSDRGFVFKVMHFFRDFDEDQLEDLLKLQMRNSGEPVTWTHVIHLLSVDNVTLRSKLLQRTVDNDLSPEELYEEIQKESGPSGRRGVGGRGLKIPATTEACVTNIIRQCYFWERNREKIWHDVISRVEKMPADKITPDFMTRLDESVNYMQQIQDDAASMEASLLQAKKVAEKRAKEQAALGTNSKTQKKISSNKKLPKKSKKKGKLVGASK